MQPDPNALSEQNDPLASWKTAVLIAIVAAGLIFVGGLLGTVAVGDEVYHQSFARNWAAGGLLARPVFNPIYRTGDWPGYYYASEPLWPGGLGAVWWLTGFRAWTGQLYQAAWLTMLLLGLYFAGRHLTDPRGGLAAMLIGMTVPMFTAFSVLLFVDVAATALATLTLLAILKRRWFLAGTGLALLYLTKRNAFFLMPSLGLWVFLDEFPWRAAWSAWRHGPSRVSRLRETLRRSQFARRVWRTLLFAAPAVLAFYLDKLWRVAHMPVTSDPGSLSHILKRFGSLFTRQQLSSYLTNPLDVLKYLGPVLLILLVVFLARRAWKKPDGWLGLVVLLFMAATAILFSLDTDIRYIMPMVPILVLMAMRGLGGWRRKTAVLAMLAAAGLATVGTTSIYVGLQRKVTPGQTAVFEYLRDHTPPDTLVLYPGELLMAESNRPVIWAQVRRLPILLRERDPDRFLNILQLNNIKYISIFKTKIEEDPGGNRVAGGYLRWWVEQLRTPPFLRFLEEVPGDWPDMELWRVKPGVEPPVPPKPIAVEEVWSSLPDKP